MQILQEMVSSQAGGIRLAMLEIIKLSLGKFSLVK